MSKVVNAIMAIKENNCRVKQTKLFQDVFAVREAIQHLHADTETQYRISVTLGAQCWTTDADIRNKDTALEMAIKRTKKQVVEAIFGEFREDFRNIERALYDSNLENAREMLYTLERKMFEVTTND